MPIPPAIQRKMNERDELYNQIISLLRNWKLHNKVALTSQIKKNDN